MQSPTVLVADSDHLQRQTIELLLAEFTVVSFATGQEALEYFQTHSPALAIFAARMPDINGTDVCGRIKSIKRLRHIPIIITTSQQRYGTVKDLARAVRADLVLPRPLEDQDLATQVRGLIDPESFLTPIEEIKDGEAIERALKRLETKSARQLEEEEDLKDLLEANQNLHRQLEALKQENRQLKEGSISEEEIKSLHEKVEKLRKENQQLKDRVAATEDYDTLHLDLESLKKDYADLEAQVEQSNSQELESLQAELGTAKDNYDTLKRDFEKLKKDYADLETQTRKKSKPEKVKKLQAELDAATTNYNALQLDFENLNKDYFELKAQISDQSDSQDLERLQTELEHAKENQQRLSAKLAEFETNPENIVYRGEAETLQALEELRNKQSIQEKQLETLRKHNQKLLKSINEMQVNQSSRRSILDRFRS